ncbi:glucose-1-phosphate adenylyltransferase subunit GlgD [Paenibacillus gansuensis]|uniref:Glucose-1-phosphate adenylyltransferase subunit GlgD n=1 Tax=Paenibacillus gansuensis TaxID=306542 RepID=A0ABW5PBE3_9BACL
MQDILGIVNLTHTKEEALAELTWNRCVGTLPFAANYKLIDFALSNLVNSGITKAAVLSNANSRALINHVSSGKAWGMERRRGGLTVLPTFLDFGYLTGDVHKFYAHLDYLESCPESYVLLTSSHMISSANYLQLFEMHQQRNADVTVLYKPIDPAQEEMPAGCDVLQLDSKGYVTGAAPSHTAWNHGIQNVYMGTAVMSKDFLVQQVRKTYAEGKFTTLMDAVLHADGACEVFAHPYYGYTANISCTSSYLKASLDLLRPQVWEQLLGGDQTVFTPAIESSPTQYALHSIVRNSLIAGDCIIEGNVENCVIFHESRIARGARLKNCVVLHGSRVDADADYENVIIGPNGVITPEEDYIGVDKELPAYSSGLLI